MPVAKQQPQHFQNEVYFFCAVNITRDIKSFVMILILLKKTQIVEI